MTRIALESTVITHGLPYPQNVEVAYGLERIALRAGCQPKTIGVIAGEIKVGLTNKEIKALAEHNEVLKAGVRELPYVVGKRLWASTTVSATAHIAAMNNISVFATGGIGGVHPGLWDVSQDIIELSKSNLIVISAGPKAILDLWATYEMLETFGVMVVGYNTDDMPAFYSRHSGIPIPRVDSPQEIAQIYLSTKELQHESALLVFNPIPEVCEIENDKLQLWLEKANKNLIDQNITGKQVTPFLLQKMAEYSEGRTIESNKKLLENNVQLGCEILKALSKVDE